MATPRWIICEFCDRDDKPPDSSQGYLKDRVKSQILKTHNLSALPYAASTRHHLSPQA
jgi:hypothetical protein